MNTAVIDDLKDFIEQKIDTSAQLLESNLRQEIKQGNEAVMTYVGDALDTTNNTIEQTATDLRQEIKQTAEDLRGEIKQGVEGLGMEIKQSAEEVMGYVGDALDVTNETVKQSAQDVMNYVGDALDVGNAVRDGQLGDHEQRIGKLERRTKVR